MAIEDAEEECAAGKFSDDGHRERVERIRWLRTAIRNVEPGNAYPIGLAYHEVLLGGLCCALGLQHLDAYRLSEHDPLGLRFITWHSLWALDGFITALEDSVEGASERVEYE